MSTTQAPTATAPHPSDPTVQPEPLTHAERNPDLPILPPRRRNNAELSDGQKSAKKDAAEANRKAKVNLVAELQTLKHAYEASLAEAARKHNTSAKHVERLIGTSAQCKKKRAPSAANAILHHVATLVNEGRRSPETLDELRARIKEDEEWANLDEERIEELKQELVEWRQSRVGGARTSHKSTAQDIRLTLLQVQKILKDLHSRTGAVAFGFISQGSTDCTGQPGWFNGGTGYNFVQEHFHMNMWDMAAFFESWALATDKVTKKRDSAAKIRAECTSFILAGLKFMTRIENVKMSYSNYKVDIIKQYNVILEGWPEKVPFSPPSSMEALEDVRTLLQDLRTGTCRWRKVTTAELKEVNAELEQEVAGGKKKRAERKDKGVARGPNARGKENRATGGKKRKAADLSNDDNQPRTKKRKSNKSPITSQLPPHPAHKSAAFIDDDEDDEEEDHDAETGDANA